MSAEIIALPNSKVNSRPATHQVTPDTIIFMGHTLIALGRSMAGQADRDMHPSTIIDGLMQCWHEIAQTPVK